MTNLDCLVCALVPAVDEVELQLRPVPEKSPFLVPRNVGPVEEDPTQPVRSPAAPRQLQILHGLVSVKLKYSFFKPLKSPCLEPLN